jgi:hypothetical protein
VDDDRLRRLKATYAAKVEVLTILGRLDAGDRVDLLRDLLRECHGAAREAQADVYRYAKDLGYVGGRLEGPNPGLVATPDHRGAYPTTHVVPGTTVGTPTAEYTVADYGRDLGAARLSDGQTADEALRAGLAEDAVAQDRMLGVLLEQNRAAVEQVSEMVERATLKTSTPEELDELAAQMAVPGPIAPVVYEPGKPLPPERRDPRPRCPDCKRPWEPNEGEDPAQPCRVCAGRTGSSVPTKVGQLPVARDQAEEYSQRVRVCRGCVRPGEKVLGTTFQQNPTVVCPRCRRAKPLDGCMVREPLRRTKSEGSE